MGRSTNQQAAENREKVVESAAALFRKRGVDNVSLAEVMAHTGMTTGGFYKRFASKNALVTEAIDLTFEQSAKRWRKVYQNADRDGPDSLAHLVHQYLANGTADRRCPILAYAPLAGSSEATEEAVQAYASGTHRLFELMSSAAAEGGVIKAGGPNIAALFAAMVGARMLRQAVGDAFWIRDVEDAVR